MGLGARIFAAVSMSFALGGAASAGTAYSSFGANGSNCDCFSPEASGPATNKIGSIPQGTTWLAASFVPKVAGALNSLNLSLGLSQGYRGAIVILVTDDGSGAAPATLTSGALEIWVNFTLPDAADHQRFTTFRSVAHPALAVGTRYWIIVEPVGLDTDIVWWSSPKVKSPVLWSGTGGGNWAGFTGSQSAFNVVVN